MTIKRTIPDYLLGALRQYKSNCIDEVKDEFVFGLDIDETLVQIELLQLGQVTKQTNLIVDILHEIANSAYYDDTSMKIFVLIAKKYRLDITYSDCLEHR
jgi:hypothetical protein